MNKPFSQILMDRGCDPHTAELAAKVIAREIAGETMPGSRTPEEQEAVVKAWAQLDVAIAGYGS